jgi:hypothetical protein
MAAKEKQMEAGVRYVLTVPAWLKEATGSPMTMPSVTSLRRSSKTLLLKPTAMTTCGHLNWWRMPIGLPHNYQNERLMYNSSRHDATMAQRISSYAALSLLLP